MKINYKHCLVSMLCYAFFLSAAAQQKQVTGRVTDSTMVPIPGVNVQLSTAARGTTTNFEGEFSLKATPNDTLVVSYMGYQTQKVAIGQQEYIPLILIPVANALQEVVINAGYYTTTERERTGNIAKVTAEEIELQPLVSPLQALQGRMAGVEVSPGSDLPGAAPTIRIRGQNSLRDEGNYPLYIIDGMPLNATPLESNSNLSFTGIDPLSTLNLANIESIEVLKDADATAIYGSRGANGVVLITTKKGIAERTQVEARVYTGAATVPNRMDLLSTKQYLQIRRRAFENDGVEPTQSNAYDLLVWNQNRETDWQEFFFGGTAKITDAQLGVSGGNAQTRYRLTGSYHRQGTVYPGQYRYEKITGGLHLNHVSPNQRFSLQLALNYGADLNKLVGYTNYQNAFAIPPNAPDLFTENGELNWEGWGISGRANPLEGFFNHSQTWAHQFISNLNLSYRVVKGLHLKANLGYSRATKEELVKRPMRSLNPALAPYLGNRSVHSSGERRSWIVEPQLAYQTPLGEGKLEALIGASFQNNQNNSLGLTGIGYVTEPLIGNLEAAEQVVPLSHRKLTYKYTAGFARLAYQWKDRYFVNLTGRRDGSSRFGPDKRFANFGAVGAAWIFTEENFFKQHAPWLSFGKLRGSYGTTGNDQIGDYGYLDSYVATTGPQGLYPTALANADYSWEVNKKLEVGMQLGFFKDRINMGLSGYRNRSSSQLVGYNLPALTGFTTVQANLPATVENKGWELELSSLNLAGEHWKWRSAFNITFPNNQLRSYPRIEESPYANRYRVGEPLNIALLYQYEGLDPETGLYQFTDVNGDGNYDYKDQVVVKDLDRTYYGGFQNTLSYRDFSLSCLFQFVKQEGRLSRFYAGELANQRQSVRSTLDGEGPYQVITQQGSTPYTYALQSPLAYTDASFIRLKSLSVNYNFPKKLLKELPVTQCQLFFHAQNLFTLTDYEGMDPEMPSGGTAFGTLRTFTTGIELKF